MTERNLQLSQLSLLDAKSLVNDNVYDLVDYFSS